MLTLDLSIQGRHDGDDASTKMEEVVSKDSKAAAAAEVYDFDIVVFQRLPIIAIFDGDLLQYLFNKKIQVP